MTKNSTLLDSFGRTIRITDKRFSSTYFAALLPIANLLRQSGVLDPALKAIASHTNKRKHLYSVQGMFLQRLFGLTAGFEDLADHDVICEDAGFRASLGQDSCASSSTLCRFENSVDRHCLDALNQSLLKCLVKINRIYQIIPEPVKDRDCVLILDVDSTHVDLYGNQEGKSYNGHYGCCCLAPVLCFLNGWPVAVFNASGTTDARAILNKHFERLIKALQKAFPRHKILLRTDGGFNCGTLIEQCEELGCFYITGLSPNRKTQRLAKAGLGNPTRKTIKCYTQKGYAHRTLGELVGYKAKSWKSDRRVIARKQFNPLKKLQSDLRLIQTNIRDCKRDEDGYCPYFSRLSHADLYERIYCQRGQCELNIEEFKSECFGSRASASRKLTNSYRMILSAFCQMILKLVRHVLLPKQKECSGKQQPSVTVRTLRRAFFGITAMVRELKKVLQLTLPSHLLHEELLMKLFKIPIAVQA